MNWKEWFATFKLLMNIAGGYFSKWAYLTIFLLYFDIKLPGYFNIIFLVSCLGLTVLDWIKIFPVEQGIVWKKNIEYQNLKRSVKK